MNTIGPIVWIIEKREVDRNETSRTVSFLKQLLSSVDSIRHNEENIDLSFSGYDNVRWELYEIPEVRSFIHELDRAFPYWFYFLTKSGGGLPIVALSFLPPFLTPEGKKSEFPPRLMSFVEGRWGPALNKIVAHVGLPDSRADILLTRSIQRIMNGRINLEENN